MTTPNITMIMPDVDALVVKVHALLRSVPEDLVARQLWCVDDLVRCIESLKAELAAEQIAGNEWAARAGFMANRAEAAEARCKEFESAYEVLLEIQKQRRLARMGHMGKSLAELLRELADQLDQAAERIHVAEELRILAARAEELERERGEYAVAEYGRRLAEADREKA